MRLRIPFTNKHLLIGASEIKAQLQKDSVVYGGLQNGLSQFVNFGGRVAPQALYDIYNSVVDVKQAVRKIQNAVMKPGYYWVNKKNPDIEASVEQVRQAEEIFNRRGLTASTLKDLWVRDINVAGNAYWLKLRNANGEVIGLKPVDPRTMAIQADKYGNVQQYIQRVAGYEPVFFPPEDIYHSIMDFSTDHAIMGMSPIEAIYWEAKTEISAQRANFYFYENNAVPSHLLIAEGELDAEQMEELKMEIDKQFKGVNNKFKSGLIPFIKDIKTITPSQKDMEYIESRKFTVKKIVVAFGVDGFILGYTEGVQRSNGGIIYKNFYENTVRAYEVYLEEVINNILEDVGLDQIEFKVKESNYDNEKEMADISRMDVQFGVMTINEARQKRGLEPSDNELADELMYNGLVLDDLGAEFGEVKSIFKEKVEKKNREFYNLLES